MYYFKITEDNLDFITEINGGVRPTVLDEDGHEQYYVVNLKDQPNQIISRGVFHYMRNLVQFGTRIVFVPGLGVPPA